MMHGIGRARDEVDAADHRRRERDRQGRERVEQFEACTPAQARADGLILDDRLADRGVVTRFERNQLRDRLAMARDDEALAARSSSPGRCVLAS